MSSHDVDYLRLLKRVSDSDDIRIKEIIKKRLLKNEDIIHILNNKSLEESEAEPSDYFNVNIFPYYIIDDTQTNVENYICYETGYTAVDNGNDVYKYGQITFYVLCDIKNLVEPETGICRHDLLGALLLEEFNWSNFFGTQIKCVADKSGVTDDDYAMRTLIFEMVTPNNITRTGRQSHVTRIVNNGPRSIRDGH